jgi:RimJ/RimL family protein N-acetyltransferase
MLKTRNLPKRIACKDFKLVKLSLKKDDLKLEELLEVYKANLENFKYWHHEYEELLFNSIQDIKVYLSCSICYVIQFSGKIIGFIEVVRLSSGEDGIKPCLLTFCLDKNYSGKGIMYTALSKIEKVLIKLNFDCLSANVDTDNEPSLKLMEKLKYKTVSSSWMIAGNDKIFRYMSFRKECLHGAKPSLRFQETFSFLLANQSQAFRRDS